MGTFRDAEKARYSEAKPVLFSPEACRPGTYKGRPRDFCLADGHSAENLCESFRDEALSYFRARLIPWHDGLCDDQGRQSALPSNHLCCSQSACVNALWPLTSNPDVLARAFRRFLPDLSEPLPFDADGVLPGGGTSYLAFEWIGTRNYLGERSWGTRGANCTSADFAFRFRRLDGRVHLVLGEWKYTEYYGKQPPDPAKINQTQLETYRSSFGRWRGMHPELPQYEMFFVEPFYQLMRLTLLAQEMERARLAGKGEMGADVVSVLHVSPKANLELRENLAALPTLRKYGSTLGAAWSAVAPTGRFAAVDSEDLLMSLAHTVRSQPAGWSAYLTSRYGWYKGASCER